MTSFDAYASKKGSVFVKGLWCDRVEVRKGPARYLCIIEPKTRMVREVSELRVARLKGRQVTRRCRVEDPKVIAELMTSVQRIYG